MQAVGLFFAAFFGVCSAVALLLGIHEWLLRSRRPAKVKVVILPGQGERLAYTLLILRRLQERGYIDIQSVVHAVER